MLEITRGAMDECRVFTDADVRFRVRNSARPIAIYVVTTAIEMHIVLRDYERSLYVVFALLDEWGAFAPFVLVTTILAKIRALRRSRGWRSHAHTSTSRLRAGPVVSGAAAGLSFAHFPNPTTLSW